MAESRKKGAITFTDKELLLDIKSETAKGGFESMEEYVRVAHVNLKSLKAKKQKSHG